MNLLEKKRLLMSTLSDWKHWVVEGRPKYGEQQYYYDDYHCGLWPLLDGPALIVPVYRFSIQLSDSPNGDYWWLGKFRALNCDTDVEILEEGGEWR